MGGFVAGARPRPDGRSQVPPLPAHNPSQSVIAVCGRPRRWDENSYGGCCREPGKWQRGWQYHRSSSLEHHFRETVVLNQSCAADQAHLRSHSCPGSSAVLHGAPTATEIKVEPMLLRDLVLERLRLPLDVTEAKCECGLALDVQGRHRAACHRSGRLRT